MVKATEGNEKDILGNNFDRSEEIVKGEKPNPIKINNIWQTLLLFFLRKLIKDTYLKIIKKNVI